MLNRRRESLRQSAQTARRQPREEPDEVYEPL
jgi:hypothetical protein